MERKLVSLPSFFVLLLVAGIAFLAVPVVELHAGVPTVTVARTTPATGTASSGNLVFRITFSEAVKVTGETPSGGSAVPAGDGFGIEDIEVKFAPAATPAGRTETSLRDALASELAKADATNTLGVGTIFTVTLAIPSNENGTATVSIRPAGVGADQSAFESSADSMAFADGGTTTIGIPYATHDGMKPTVTIATTATSVGSAPFLVTFTIADPAGGAFAAAGPTFALGSINVTGGDPIELGDITGSGLSYTVSAYVQATQNADPPVSEVLIGVAANAVMDAAGNGNDAVPHVRGANDTPPAVSGGTLRVAVDTVAPFVAISTVTTPTSPSATTPLTSIAVTFSVKEGSATGDPTRIAALGASAARAIVANEVTVEGGTISVPVVKPGTFNAVFTATVTPAATATEVTIGVNRGAVEDAAGNVNEANTTPAISTGYVAPTTGPATPAATGTTGTKLTGGDVGFTFDASIGANGFVVLAKSPHGERNGNALPNDAGFTSALTTAIDINDDAWQDLRHFLVTTEGGTIDLIGPAGTPVKSVVISEVMWGSDNGKTDPSSSQWIELYNTTDAPITIDDSAAPTTWKLQFSTKSYGGKMLTGAAAKAVTAAPNGAVTTTAHPVVDKLSTWREVGNYWLWEITDTAGGSHGQSGKSTRNSATSPGTPSELISMQRKINYATVNPTKAHDATDAVKNRNKELEGIPGTAAGNWEASPEHGHLLTYRKGTPGAAPTIQRHDKTGVARSSVLFNEIANRTKKEHDWIELYNKSSSPKKINGWELSVVTATGTDTELFIFTSDNDINVPAKGYLLIVNSGPNITRLEGGYNLTDPGSSERQGAESVRPYYVTDKLDIPASNFLLILRNGNDKTGTHEKIEDIAGNNPAFPSDADNTDVWPLRVWDLGAIDDLGAKDDKTWVRDQGKDVFHGDAWKDGGGFTGVGIKRQYDSGDLYTSGTPGYANGAVQNEVKSDGLTETNPVIISEIMFATDSRAPQWIELHNPSHTQAVNLDKWVLEVFNYHGDELEVNDYADLVLPAKRIQPNQTVLIVSRKTTRRSVDAFPDDRTIGIWDEPELRKKFAMQNRNDAVLSSIGFHLKLSDPKKKVVDEVGNIDANRRNSDEPIWALPDGTSEEGSRSSMVRDIEGAANDGTVSDAWRDADVVDSNSINSDANELYYGDPDDVGTPGYTPGGVLPVQLSSFYSKRNDAGAVIITWSTESELDNAGFNILRSLSRAGEFTRINAQLIPGAGTTGEKNTYTWTDTSARPNVVYYYQIEDVSLDGEHRTLRTTRLRGYVGAAGKATIIWGELKSRD